MSRRRLIPFVILLLYSAFGIQIAFAQNDVTDDEVNRVASQLFCPTCEAIPVDVCPTEVCSDWRAEIRAQLEAGRTEREILDDFAAQYGSGVLANPPPRGIGLFVWIVPTLVAVLGLGIFVWQIQKLQAQRAHAKASTPPLAAAGPSPPPATQDDDLDEYRRRLEEELK